AKLNFDSRVRIELANVQQDAVLTKEEKAMRVQGILKQAHEYEKPGNRERSRSDLKAVSQESPPKADSQESPNREAVSQSGPTDLVEKPQLQELASEMTRLRFETNRW